MKLPKIIHDLKAEIKETIEHFKAIGKELEQMGLKKDVCPTCVHLRGLDGDCRWCGEIDR